MGSRNRRRQKPPRPARLRNRRPIPRRRLGRRRAIRPRLARDTAQAIRHAPVRPPAPPRPMPRRSSHAPHPRLPNPTSRRLPRQLRNRPGKPPTRRRLPGRHPQGMAAPHTRQPSQPARPKPAPPSPTASPSRSPAPPTKSPWRQRSHAYIHAVAANLVSAGARLIPLGQTQAQIAIAQLAPVITDIAERAQATSLDDLGTAAPAIELCSLRHETQYTRLFRS